MLNSLSKNVWMILTIVIPGIFTYGLFRILLIIHETTVFNTLFDSMDSSISINACVIVIIGLIQQMFGILLEALIAIILKGGSLKRLVWDRHLKKEAVTDREQLATGNFYLSLNITIGLFFLLSAFVVFKFDLRVAIPLFLLFIVSAGVTIFRAKIAMEIV
jgi:hypothetical protein